MDLKKKDSTVYKKMYFEYKYTDKFKVKGWEKIHHAVINTRKE